MINVMTVILVLVYLGGIWKFWKGFDKTNFESQKLMLALLWPILLTNRSYRQNFSRALKN